MLIHQLYCSRAVKPFTATELDDLMEVSRSNNGRLDVSGLLIYNSGMFLQLLEGEYDAVTKLTRKIRMDERHMDFESILMGDAPGRLCPGWSMGLVNLEGELDFDTGVLTSLLRDPETHEKIAPARRGRAILEAIGTFARRLSTEASVTVGGASDGGHLAAG